jgi:flagellar motility protein MotE (MotC chaperone)
VTNRIQIILLLGVILAVIAGVLYFLDSKGMINVEAEVRTWGGALPYAGAWFSPPASAPASELLELERLQAERARDDRWAALRKKEDDLQKAEGLLNEERSRLSQWEGELERRELAIDEREKEFTDREKQYDRAVQYYLTMRPAAAAKVLSQQEDLLVIEIFRRMPERNVSAIMAEMDPAVAGAIMRKMSRSQ